MTLDMPLEGPVVFGDDGENEADGTTTEITATDTLTTSGDLISTDFSSTTKLLTIVF